MKMIINLRLVNTGTLERDKDGDVIVVDYSLV